MRKLRLRIAKLMTRYDARPVRERVLIFLTLLALFTFIIDTVLVNPIMAEHGRVESLLASKEAEVKVLDQQAANLRAEQAQDPKTLAQARLKELERQLEALKSSATAAAQLVDAREMGNFIGRILHGDHGFEIVAVENLPPVLLQDDKSTTTENHTVVAQDTPKIYKHGVRIQIRGGYRDLVGFLRSLETLPWKVLWGKVELETAKYPTSQLTVVIYTLSLDQAWIGV